jgi:hypothetical protein
VSDGSGSALQPSASRSALLLECVHSIGQKTRGGTGDRESADYGSAFHEIMAGIIIGGWVLPTRELVRVCLASWGLSEDFADELLGHLKESTQVLRAWLSGKNPFKIDFLDSGKLPAAGGPIIAVETAFALGPHAARMIAPATKDDHQYEELVPGEIAGTTDLVVIPGKTGRRKKVPLLVIDHKTGQEDFFEPLTKPQLLTLGRAAGLVYGLEDNVIVGVLHARRRGFAAVYADEVPPRVLAAHSARLFKSMERVGDGSMRPGPWCSKERCPWQSGCPARDAQLIENAGGLLARLGKVSGNEEVSSGALVRAEAAGVLSRPKRIGALYAVIQQAEKLADAGRREIRNEVLAGAVPEMPDGGYLTIRRGPFENLSKASIIRAYGRLAGEKLLTKLRRDKAIEVSERVSLHVEKERGQ